MSHQVESMMFAVNPPWHGLGTFVGNKEVNSSQAITSAGLDWTVSRRELFIEQGNDLLEVESNKAIVRDTDSKILGVVGSRYQPIQNADAFSFLDSLASDGSIKYHTAGSLKGGVLIWILAVAGKPMWITEEDEVRRFILFSNTHNGSGSALVIPTSVRVVCANTHALALRGRGKRKTGLSFRHSSNIKKNMEKAADLIRKSNDVFDEYEAKCQKLAEVTVSDSQWSDFAMHMFPNPDDDAASEKTERGLKSSITKATNLRSELQHLFVNGNGQEKRSVKGTAWAALNSVTEFKDFYKRSSSHESRVEGAWMGTGAELADKAYNYLTQTFA